ncbi:hypothetical protein C8N41_101407 [Winogradskyella sediminis]|nr:hypothetical protein C8N41_101407 [Winogradskyella sediminis]
MNLKFHIIILFLGFGFLTNCSESKKQNSKVNQKEIKTDDAEIINIIENDSTELIKLMRKAYYWHSETYLPDLPLNYEKGNDSIFIGIDWNTYDKNVQILNKTNFFTNDFIIYHKNIASNIDKSIKKAGTEWRNINDGIPIWAYEADEWCNCQDFPDRYWETIIIDDLKINNGLATFNLNWKTGNQYHSMNYEITAKKIDLKWKINSLEGFKNYKSSEEYDKLIAD